MVRRRILRPEEEALWQTVAQTARRLKDGPAGVPASARPAPPAKTPPDAPDPAVSVTPFRVGERAAARDRGTTLPDPAAPPLRMDAKAFARMSRGKLAPTARIDLHGLTLAEAHPALIGFVLRAQAAGHRLVLVITGKGRPGADDGPIPRRPGVLRQQVPLWLRQPPLGPMVQQVAEAHPRHGGAGALYLYLRRPG